MVIKNLLENLLFNKEELGHPIFRKYKDLDEKNKEKRKGIKRKLKNIGITTLALWQIGMSSYGIRNRDYWELKGSKVSQTLKSAFVVDYARAKGLYFSARSVVNPLSKQEEANMILDSLPDLLKLKSNETKIEPGGFFVKEGKSFKFVEVKGKNIPKCAWWLRSKFTAMSHKFQSYKKDGKNKIEFRKDINVHLSQMYNPDKKDVLKTLLHNDVVASYFDHCDDESWGKLDRWSRWIHFPQIPSVLGRDDIWKNGRWYGKKFSIMKWIKPEEIEICDCSLYKSLHQQITNSEEENKVNYILTRLRYNKKEAANITNKYYRNKILGEIAKNLYLSDKEIYIKNGISNHLNKIIERLSSKPYEEIDRIIKDSVRVYGFVDKEEKIY